MPCVDHEGLADRLVAEVVRCSSSGNDQLHDTTRSHSASVVGFPVSFAEQDIPQPQQHHGVYSTPHDRWTSSQKSSIPARTRWNRSTTMCTTYYQTCKNCGYLPITPMTAFCANGDRYHGTVCSKHQSIAHGTVGVCAKCPQGP